MTRKGAQKTKPYDQAAWTALRLKRALRRLVEADGVVTAEEARVMELADELYAETEEAKVFIQAGVRWLGGGAAFQGALACQIRDVDRLNAIRVQRIRARLVEVDAVTAVRVARTGKGKATLPGERSMAISEEVQELAA